MRGPLGNNARLSHINDCILEIEDAIKSIVKEDFINNHVVRIAVVKWIEIIGEASAHISEDLRQKYTEVDWIAIKALRNVVVHEYFGIKYDLIWEIATEHLPILKKQILTIINDLSK